MDADNPVTEPAEASEVLSDAEAKMFSNPDADGAADAAETDADAAHVADGADGDAEAAPEAPKPDPEPEGVEVEYDGKTYKLPPELKDALLRQSDYTRKTQDVAEQRKAVEAERAQTQEYRQAVETYSDAMADIRALDRQLAQFEAIDWNTLSQTNPQEAFRLEMARKTVERQREHAVQTFQQARAKALDTERQQAVKRIEEGQARLKQEIPGWGKEMAKEVRNFAESQGLTAKELDGLSDPRAVKILWQAWQFQKLANQKPIQPKPEPAKPVPNVTGAKAGPGRPDPSRMSVSDMAKYLRLPG